MTLSVVTFGAAFGAALVVGLMSLVGVLIISRSTGKTIKFPLNLLSLSAGAMLGTAFFHLLPEALEAVSDVLIIFTFVAAGFLVFFIIEQVFHWHHTHPDLHHHHGRLGYLNLAADGVHNFLDGVVIMTSFAVDIRLGIAVTIATIIHEIPQEIGDFGVLLYSGFSKARALLLNLAVALTALLGVVVGFILLRIDLDIEFFLLPFAAGVFLYIAATDLVPEIHKAERSPKSIVTFVVFVGGLVLMYLLKLGFD